MTKLIMLLKRPLVLPIRIIRNIHNRCIYTIAPLIIDGYYGGFWNFRGVKIKSHPFLEHIYYDYLAHYGAWIGVNAKIESAPCFPHGLFGIFISHMSVIGENCVIFQQVTIGSNMLKGHPRNGAPKIGNNVFIGAGAKIIGNVTIGDNCRIGANCVVVKDMPANTTAVASQTRFLESDKVNNNTFISAESYMEEH